MPRAIVVLTVLGSLGLSCAPARERSPTRPSPTPATRPTMRLAHEPPPDALPFEPLAAPSAEGAGLPVIDYCMHAFATTMTEGLQWAGAAPAVTSDRALLLLGPAMRGCAFLGGASGPRVHHIVPRGDDVVVHVGFPSPFDLSWSAALIPRPPPSGRLVLVIHGSIMGPPGDWNDAREHVLALATHAP